VPPASTGFDELVPAPAQGRVFERILTPGLGDVTPSGRVRLDAIARWLQDVAYADAEDAKLAERRAWVIRRARVRVERFPRFGQDLCLRTFCSAAATLVAERRTSITGAAAAVEAVGLWVHVDPESGLPARLGKEFDAVYGASAGGRRARSRLRHPAPPADAARAVWRFRAADLDMAGHVNNAVYWALLEEELVPGAAEPESVDVEVEFREPAPAGEATVLRAPGGLWVVGAAGEVHASLQGLPDRPAALRARA
jgi:acyl-ACP thioesterase